MLKVLFVASEAAPFAKTGGLGDVIGSLPKELKKQDMDIRVIIPKYRLIPEKFTKQMVLKATLTVPVGWRRQYAGLFELEYQGITWYFVDNEYYFKRDSLYGHYDEAERFAYFCRAVLKALPQLTFMPDIVHCHDWQTGPLAAMLKQQYLVRKEYSAIKTVFTIHNLMYQGIFPGDILGDLLELPNSVFTVDGLEFHGQVNYLKGGLAFNDVITTVSKSYAQEIQQPYFGEKLDGFLVQRQADLYGIINGIDYEEYNPVGDPYITTHYTWRGTTKRLDNKLSLQKELGLPPSREIPLIGIVSRLVAPKGLDLLAHVMDELLALNVQLVILGTGEARYEQMFCDAARLSPDKVSANITFSERLAHRIYAGSDLFLMPSQFEPCGIGQLIALRYGSIPVVREVGGLKDTVIPFNPETGEGNGFVFANYNAHEMLNMIEEAVALYQDKTQWGKLIKNAMRADHSWRQSAVEYQQLYNKLVIR
ncbi:glycogen synthase GlgA [Sporomusa acidovorans]|uniref:Glycogen synthase n=1 Tax=Sporomusa acidovorans (strain ATCC 49682 / DSM 3132 / Mol) TaxID=1123286 RepID=A0ABZ3IW10_SPOA4|nr:glycogen synthase GlgA [Sporomusa acidovorans]OZC18003.1 glycogen synthase [Sporomusa acidovorans DSM 3132]SDF42762.1 starch synthase [Sporomusa acidovorans]